MTTFINNGQPITAAPAIGYDGKNFWVYFGTGRFFDGNDKTDDTQQSFYGIKEPMSEVNATTMEFLGTTVLAPTLHGDPTSRTWPDVTADPGDKGLLKTDEIRVEKAFALADATLTCSDTTTDCLPANVDSLADLIEYMAGEEGTSDPTWSNSADGWYYDFYPYDNRERNVGQATLFGGLTLFTTYQPYSDPCKAEGVSYLYGLYYQTGTAWNNVIFGDNGLHDNNRDVAEKFLVGPGLATTPNLHVGDSGDGDGDGDGDGVKAFLQSSTGEIIRVEHDTPTGNSTSSRTGWKQCSE